MTFKFKLPIPIMAHGNTKIVSADRKWSTDLYLTVFCI